MSAALQVRPTDSAPFEVRPLSPVLAAEVIGLDLRHKLDQPTRAAIYDAFVRHHVLCFRDQKLTQDEQIAFTEQFGTLERHMARNKGTANPLVHIVSNLGPDGQPSGKVGSHRLAQRQILPAGAVARHHPARDHHAAEWRGYLLRRHVCRV